MTSATSCPDVEMQLRLQVGCRSVSDAPPDAAPPESAPKSSVVSVPLDADDTRGRHFRRLMVSPATLIIAGICIVAAFIALSATVSVGIGGAAAGAIVLLTLIVVFFIANSMAAKDFYTAYAQARGLQWSSGHASVPPVTSLLRKGDSRYTEQQFTGTLPGGLNGTLALYTYEDETTDSEGNTDTTYYHFTIAMCQLPEIAQYIQEMAVQRRVGFRFLDSAEDKFRKRQRVETESEETDKKFEMFIGENDDMNKARQILSPSFIVWLADKAPEAFTFELVAGSLVCAVKGHKKSAGELDLVCESSSAVARRLAEEARD
jgi:hypothetical protein